MRNFHGKRAALTAALSVVAIVAASPGMANPWDWSPYDGPVRRYNGIKHYPVKKKAVRKVETKTPAPEKNPIPAGPLQIVVSIKSQRVTLYANGVEVARSPVSTGTPGHPTPMGLFTVIQKDRHHVSNLYNASMPYMQRITWSGSAMHQGPLPGYPASHGCIRLTTDFAVMLWKATKIGVRVVIAREEVTPVDIEHPQLLMPKPKLDVVLRPSLPVRTADGANVVPGAVVPDSARPTDTVAATVTPAVSAPVATPGPAADQVTANQVKADQSIVAPAETSKPAAASTTQTPPNPVNMRSIVADAVASERDLRRRGNPVSVFVSRKDNRLYVRQAMEPVFDVPVTIRNANEPIGTHVFTAMSLKHDGAAMRWNAMSIPSSYPRPAITTRKAKAQTAAPVAPAADQPLPTAGQALDRLELTQDIRDQLGAMLSPGSSLIISDNSLASGETGSYTDFIVLTK